MVKLLVQMVPVEFQDTVDIQGFQDIVGSADQVSVDILGSADQVFLDIADTVDILVQV